jgi:hypothetical protein
MSETFSQLEIFPTEIVDEGIANGFKMWHQKNNNLQCLWLNSKFQHLLIKKIPKSIENFQLALNMKNILRYK